VIAITYVRVFGGTKLTELRTVVIENGLISRLIIGDIVVIRKLKGVWIAEVQVKYSMFFNLLLHIFPICQKTLPMFTS